MAAAPLCSLCLAPAVRQGRPAGLGSVFVPLCGSNRCAARLGSAGRTIGLQLSKWLDTKIPELEQSLSSTAAAAVIDTVKQAVTNSSIDMSTLADYSFLVFPRNCGSRVFVSGMPRRSGDMPMDMIVGKTLNTLESLRDYMRDVLRDSPNTSVLFGRDFVWVTRADTSIQYTFKALFPIGNTTRPSFWLIDGDGAYLDAA